MWDTLWAALGIALILEAILPFTAPQRTKELWRSMSELPDSALRGYALFLLVLGLIIVMLVTN